MVKYPKLELNVCKNAASQRLGVLQSALNPLFAMLPLLPPYDDIRCSQSPLCSVALVAKAVSKVVICIVHPAVHSHMPDQVWAQACTHIFEKFPF